MSYGPMTSFPLGKSPLLLSVVLPRALEQDNFDLHAHHSFS